MEILLLAVPFITSTIMFAIKKLAGLYMTDNGPSARPWLRAMLVFLSLVGYVAAAQLSGVPVDPNIVTQDVMAFMATGVLAYLAHAFYNSAFRR
jgi:hypothetical protein